MRRHYGTADLATVLRDIISPATRAAEAELGEARVRRVRRAARRAVATGRRAAANSRHDIARALDRLAWLVWALGWLAHHTARVIHRAADAADPYHVGPVAPRPVPTPLAPVADLATLRAALAPTLTADEPTPPADPITPPGFRSVRWEPDMDEPADPAFAAPVATADEPTPTDPPPAVDPAPVATEPTAEPAPTADLPADPAPTADEPAPAAKPARKPRTRKAPAVRLAPSAARITTPPPAVYLADVRPLTLPQLAGSQRGRYGAVATVRSGWATDCAVLVRVPGEEREAIAAKLVAGGADPDGRPVPVSNVLPGSIDPRPLTLTGRVWGEGCKPLAVLTREDGAAWVVDLQLYLTLVKHSPKGTAVYSQPDNGKGNGRPLVAFSGDPSGYRAADAAGVIMPMAECDPAKYEPWTDADEPLTLTHKAGSVNTRYTLTRGQWGALLDYLRTGRPAMDCLGDAADGGVSLPAGAARVKLAGLLDLAGGAPAVRALLGMPTAAAAA